MFQLDNLGEDLKVDLDVGKMLSDALKLKDTTLNMQEVLDSCNKNDTFFKAFKITKETEIMDTFSFTSLKEDIDKVCFVYIHNIPLPNTFAPIITYYWYFIYFDV